MDVSARAVRTSAPPENEALLKAAASWVNQLARTLKTCRLYDVGNPTVVRFREDLGIALHRLLDEQGALTLRFSADDVQLDETSLYSARSRDDNLALPFYRDGVRAITFSPGIAPQELEAFLDRVLQVSGQNLGEDDLVTLLWEAHLPHIDVDYVPADSEFGSGEAAESDGEGSPMPWPHAQPPEEEGAVAVAEGDEVEAAGDGRSDDWPTGHLTVEIETGFGELEKLAITEVPRFRGEFDAEHAVTPLTTALAILRASLAAGANAEDAAELGRFVPRLLRQAITRGAWLEAREALALIQKCAPSDWSLATFVQEMMQPISISTVIEHIDQQEPAAVAEFIALATEIGEQGPDWLTQVLAESQQRRHRRALAEAIAELCRENPERLAPWLADRRWYVVRNVVHILGWIGGSATVGMLQVALRNPDVRVRQEVVAALGQVDAKAARPLLLKLLDSGDTRTFCSALHQIAAERDPTVARLLVGYMTSENFEARPPEEKRAIYSALSTSAGDESIPALEDELFKGNWFSRNQEQHRQSVARCIARIGTPMARMVLVRGSSSRRGPVRTACETALSGWTGHDG
jgi:HEAT repeat protein